jgi:hypothetical protein
MLRNKEFDEQLLCRKWLIVNEEIPYKRIIPCSNGVELRNTGKYLHKIRCKRDSKISNT